MFHGGTVLLVPLVMVNSPRIGVVPAWNSWPKTAICRWYSLLLFHHGSLQGAGVNGMLSATVPPWNSAAHCNGWCYGSAARVHRGTTLRPFASPARCTTCCRGSMVEHSSVLAWGSLIQCGFAAPAYACGEEFYPGTKMAYVCHRSSMRNVLLWFHGVTLSAC